MAVVAEVDEVDRTDESGFGDEAGTVIAQSSEHDTGAFADSVVPEIEELTDPHAFSAPAPATFATPKLPALDQDEAFEEFGRAEHTVADDGSFTALLGDLEQVDFFLDQGIADEARSLLDDIAGRYPPSPLIEERRAKLDTLELEAQRTPGATPTDEGAPSLAYGGGGTIPKAVVAAGGEMDYSTHRDLGIGYKDMGLFDAAISEFAIVQQDPGQEVFALTMIGECHEAKGGLPEAVQFYKKALNRPAITDPEATHLYYQLGSAFQALGDRNEALYFFEKVAKRDPGFRDVRRRLAELRGPRNGVGR
jgi:hypothetical protein